MRVSFCSTTWRQILYCGSIAYRSKYLRHYFLNRMLWLITFWIYSCLVLYQKHIENPNVLLRTQYLTRINEFVTFYLEWRTRKCFLKISFTRVQLFNNCAFLSLISALNIFCICFVLVLQLSCGKVKGSVSLIFPYMWDARKVSSIYGYGYLTFLFSTRNVIQRFNISRHT